MLLKHQRCRDCRFYKVRSGCTHPALCEPVGATAIWCSHNDRYVHTNCRLFAQRREVSDETPRFTRTEDGTILRLRQEFCYHCVNQPGCIHSPMTRSGETCRYFLRRSSK